MPKRVFNLCRAELLKLSRQRLPYVAAVVAALVLFLSLYGTMRAVASDVERERKVFQDDNSSFLPPQDGETGGVPKEKKGSFFPELPRSRGFECLVRTWQYSLSIVSFFLLVFGSLLVSSEVASGTARTSLQRPVRRIEFLLAKATILAAATLAAVVLVGALSTWLVHTLVGFGDVTDLEWGKVIVTEAQMAGYFIKLAPILLMPLVCAGFLGFFVSTFVGSSGASVGVAVIAHYVAGSLLKIFKVWGEYYFDHYSSQGMDWLLQLSRGIKTDLPKMDAIGWTSMHYYVPAIYLLVFIALPLLAFGRKDIVT
jgi:ABC-type transport system involved in multi-copper enzyme maturation permease subunit